MAQLVKTVAGLAIVSVKTMAGLAIASSKTIMGVDNTSGGGTAQYFWSFDPVASPPTGTFDAQSFTLWTSLVVGFDGDATKLAVSFNSANGNPFKIALYNNSDHLLIGATAGSSTNGLNEVNISSTHITAGTYKVAITCLGNGSDFVMSSITGTTNVNGPLGYFNWPLDPLPSIDFTLNLMAVAVFVTP